MPGVAGYVNLTADTPVTWDLSSVLLKPLVHESCYQVRQLRLPKGGVVAVVDPGINNHLCGSTCAEAGISVAFYGEFHGKEFSNAKCGNEIADTLSRLYQLHGEALPGLLNGSFIVLISDSNEDRTLIFTDHYASRPLFCTQKNGRLYFAPELKGVANVPEVDREIDPSSFVSLLAIGHLLLDRTFYKKIQPLAPGTILRIKNGQLAERRYYKYTLHGNTEDRGENYYIEHLSTLLLQSVQKRLRDIRNTVIPISGGYDSRGILACACKLTGEKVRTVSWGVDEVQEGADANIARLLSKQLNTDHHFIRRETDKFIDDIEEMVYRADGLTDDPAFHHNELSTMRKIRFELGATDLFRGDECFGDPKAANDLEALGRHGIYELENCIPLEDMLNPSRRDQLRQNYNLMLHRILETCSLTNYSDRQDVFYFTQRLFHYNNRSSYYKFTVLDVKNPWLDKDILTFYGRVPAVYRWGKSLYKKTLQFMFPEISSVPFATRNSLEDWGHVIRSDASLQRFLRHHLLEDTNQFHELLNRERLPAFLSAVFEGAHKPSIKVRSIEKIKTVARRASPALYGRFKAVVMKRIGARVMAAEELIFRMLVAKIWFDRFG